MIQTDSEQIDEVQKAINYTRFVEWKKRFRWKWEQLFGKATEKNPAETEDEIVEVQCGVTRSSFTRFDDHTDLSKA